MHTFVCFCVFGLGASSVHAVAPARVVPNDTFWGRQWYLEQIQAPEAWAVATGSRRIVVAVIDGGVDITHPDLRDNLWVNTQEIPDDGIDNDRDGFIDDIHGWNFVNDTNDVRPVWKSRQYEEAWSHGTLVSSLIAAKGNDGFGISGVAWAAQLMPVVVLDADGAGNIESVVFAIRFATKHKADVINLSLVGYDDDPRLEAAIREASQAGIVIVAATGNAEEMVGYDIDQTLAYPVCADGTTNQVIGVSGTDTLDQRAPYANYGKQCTDIAAPAQEMFAARPTYPHDVAPTSSVPGYLDKVTGTSLAAPLVSGTVVLMKSMRPDLTPDEIRRRLVEAADPGVPGLSVGRLNAGRTLQRLAAERDTVDPSLTKKARVELAAQIQHSLLALPKRLAYLFAKTP